jgi:hypothetical protein
VNIFHGVDHSTLTIFIFYWRFLHEDSKSAICKMISNLQLLKGGCLLLIRMYSPMCKCIRVPRLHASILLAFMGTSYLRLPWPPPWDAVGSDVQTSCRRPPLWPCIADQLPNELLPGELPLPLLHLFFLSFFLLIFCVGSRLSIHVCS